MLTLLDERFYPVTAQYGFLLAPMETAIGGCEEELIFRKAWHRDDLKCLTREVSGTLGDMLAEFGESEKLLGATNSVLLVDCGQWVAWFENGSLLRKTWGRCAPRNLAAVNVTVGSSLTKENGAESVLERLLSRSGRDGSVLFHLHVPSGIQYHWDRRLLEASPGLDSWLWTESGVLLPFEDASRYEREVIRERLTSVMVDAYCRELGIRPFDEDFFGLRGVIVRAPVVSEDEILIGSSYAQAQADIPDFVVGEASSYIEA